MALILVQHSQFPSFTHPAMSRSVAGFQGRQNVICQMFWPSVSESSARCALWDREKRKCREALNLFGTTSSMNKNVKLVNTTDETIFVPGLGPWRPNQIFDLPKEMPLKQHVQPRILGGALKIVGGNKRVSVDGKNVEAGKPVPGTPPGVPQKPR